MTLEEAKAAAERPEAERRVELSPACDAWMMGDRYGVITNVGHKYVWICMDRSRRTRKVTPDLITLVP